MATRLGAALLLALLGVCPLQAEKIEFAPNGEVRIPKAACTVTENGLSVTFKATRWGMYTLHAEGTTEGGLATVAGESARQKLRGSLGIFYLAKAGPCEILYHGDTGKVEALRLVPACEGGTVLQEDGKPIELDARDCTIRGVMLRYEPQPKKLCVGYWVNPKDSVFWNYIVKTPGTYEVILTQGCGKGAGGSEALLETAGTELPFVVQDTGGYQNWVDRSLGKVTFEKAGAQRLEVRVVKKARGVMDIRRIVLKPVDGE